MAETEKYPLKGILLSSIVDYVERACAENGLDPKTTTTAEFCSAVVLKETAAEKCAMVDRMPAEITKSVARIFVSHAWSGYILTTLAAVSDQCGVPESERFVWLDCFCVNQHKLGTYSTEWYSTTFHNAIQQIGLTCLVLTPVLAPTPLRRSWCLWELYGTLKTNTKLRICIPQSEKDVLFDTMRSDFATIMASICQVDAAKAEAFHAEDRDRIRDAIRQTVGMDRVNEAALDPLREWLLDTATELISQRAAHPELMRGLGLLRFDLGKLELAEQAFEESIRLRKIALEDLTGDSQALSASLASDLTNLASCVLERGNAARALNLNDEAIALKNRIADPDTALMLSNKGLCLKALRRYEEALECFGEALLKLEAQAQSRTDLAVNLQVNRAETLREMGKPEEACSILVSGLATRIDAIGRDHVATAQLMNLMGQSLMDAGRLAGAESMFTEALATRERALGKVHPRVGLCVINLAKLDIKRGAIQDARERVNRYIAAQREAGIADETFSKTAESLFTEQQPLTRLKVGEPNGLISYQNLAVTFKLPEAPQVIYSQMPVTFAYPQSHGSAMLRETSVSMMVDPSGPDFGDHIPPSSSPDLTSMAKQPPPDDAKAKPEPTAIESLETSGAKEPTELAHQSGLTNPIGGTIRPKYEILAGQRRTRRKCSIM